jgi:hypothetical protein
MISSLDSAEREDLLSADPKEALSALIYILRNDLDDGHSNIIGPSYLAGKDFSVTDPKYKGISNNMWDEESENSAQPALAS